MDKQRLLNNYFKVYEAEYPSFRNAAKYGAFFVGSGSFLLLMEMFTYFQNVQLIGSILILIGIFAFWWWARPYIAGKKTFFERPLDNDIDNWFRQDVNEVIKPLALEQLQINESQLKDENIVIIPHPVYWEVDGIEPDAILRRAADNGTFAYSVWKVQILILTQNYISFYSCIYDWLNEEVAEERTNEYFFDDISSVKNDEERLAEKFIDNPEEPIGKVKVFKLTNMSSDSLTIITEIPKLKAQAVSVTKLDKIVMALRLMLRNRRYGEVVEPKSLKEEIKKEVEKQLLESENKEVEDVLKYKGGARHFHKDLAEIHLEQSKALDAERSKKTVHKNDFEKYDEE